MDQQDMQQEAIFKMDILMWHVIKLFLKNKKQILEKFSLTCSQYEILLSIKYLQDIKPEVIQVDLSEQTHIDPMTTSTILRNLEKRKLVSRHRSTVNTRAVIVKLTPGGHDLFQAASDQMKLSNEAIYRDINKKGFTSQLMKLSNKLNKLNY